MFCASVALHHPSPPNRSSKSFFMFIVFNIRKSVISHFKRRCKNKQGGNAQPAYPRQLEQLHHYKRNKQHDGHYQQLRQFNAQVERKQVCYKSFFALEIEECTGIGKTVNKTEEQG